MVRTLRIPPLHAGSGRWGAQRGGGIAGDDDDRTALFHKVVADGQYAPADEGIVFVAVGQVGGIGEIDEIGLWQGAGNGCQNRKAADATVKNTNHYNVPVMPVRRRKRLEQRLPLAAVTESVLDTRLTRTSP